VRWCLIKAPFLLVFSWLISRTYGGLVARVSAAIFMADVDGCLIFWLSGRVELIECLYLIVKFSGLINSDFWWIIPSWNLAFTATRHLAWSNEDSFSPFRVIKLRVFRWMKEKTSAQIALKSISTVFGCSF